MARKPLLPGDRTPQQRISERNTLYKEWGITNEEVLAVPQISHLIKKLDGREHRALELLRGSPQPEARNFCAAWDSTPYHHQHIPFEAFAVKAKVDTIRLMGIIVEESIRQGGQLSMLLAATSHPKVVERTIDYAMLPDGEKDREMLHRAMRFVPTPKGATTNIQIVQNQSLPSGGKDELPSMDADIRALSDRFNERVLAAAPTEAVIEAETEEDEEE